MKAARRAESGGYFVMEVLKHDSDAWEAFVEELWKYQWTSNYTELTQELNNKLYELSVGNLDMACRTYREAQRAVIGTCDETITVATLEMGYALACGLSSKTEEVRSLKSVRALPRGKLRVPSSQQQPPSPRVDRTGDITKPQHPEFAKQLIDILGIVDLDEKIQDSDLFQRAGKSDNPLEYLRRNDALLDDPLQHFACY
ncbi:hypothetical protein FA893_17675 [Photobacterium damselae subsp. piscicida]|uniref:hypothetical protein n=1 Tax=Photobacterium damselae TaxID=38293 RepID=UPI00083F03E4|nr:hypothetical protein [Photobacterium damselae]OLQ80801.1 hypothetical protein BEI67_12590 [Photobacterium damselae subsp. piscicida]TFZ47785.1 hypothetical protein E4T25_18040 [Photobacterium damselae subsp. piscicida]TJZ83115.1 hypothetical protein FA893_17675 [Photobacterium damselae subsp. piscicida]BBC40536.1 hypothetical protein PDPE_1-01376 [Photobacterium damselae subsp. piscicida]